MAQASRHFLEEISVPNAAEKYGLTPSQLTKLARAEKIRGRKSGRDWILDEASLRMYVSRPRKTGPKPHSSISPLEKHSLHPSESPQVTTDWVQKIIEDLQRAVDVGQLSEEGRRVIIVQLDRERQVQELVRRATSTRSPSEE